MLGGGVNYSRICDLRRGSKHNSREKRRTALNEYIVWSENMKLWQAFEHVAGKLKIILKWFLTKWDENFKLNLPGSEQR